jgi:hypothetical protein
MCNFHYFVVMFRLCSPEKTRTVLPEQYVFSNGPAGDGQSAPQVSQPAGISSPSREQLVLYVPEMEEIRISPVVARKGYLNILEQKTNGWKKRWVVRAAVALKPSMPSIWLRHLPSLQSDNLHCM